MTTPYTAVGRISIHPRGFGFFNEEEAGDREAVSAFIAPPALNGFLADDRVSATLVPGADGRWSAADLKLLERSRVEVVGEVVLHRGGLHLRIDREVSNTDWALDAGDVTVNTGDHVVAKVLENNTARCLRRLDTTDERALAQVIARHGIPTTFEDDALAEARAARSVPHAVERFRRDLRDVPTITIDAPSTRDIDDAISVIPSPADGAVRLLVSIADVSAFVPEASALDLAARTRATSVYLAGKVLPMFPEELSAEWASLLPREDRACLTAELRIDPEGTVTSVDVYESVIRSWARATYDEVADFLDRGEVSENLQALRESLPWFRTVSARLGLSRARRGGVEISRDETRIVFDVATGTASAIESVRPTSAHTLIERCMVAANEAIARWLVERGVPGMFRVHDVPEPERVKEIEAFAHNFGFEAGFGRALTPLALAAFDHQLSGSPIEPAVRSVLLRSLGSARYTVFPSMHFGLAAPLYLHFTSPIRRYADLTVHRILKRYLRGDRALTPEDPELERLAEHINQRARAASRAENDRRRMLTAAFMVGHLGEVFSARVTRVRSFGILAQIDTTLVEGTLPFDKLPGGPYTLGERESSAVSETRSFAIGAPVTVKVVASDPSTGRIEFALVEDLPAA